LLGSLDAERGGAVVREVDRVGIVSYWAWVMAMQLEVRAHVLADMGHSQDLYTIAYI